MQTTAVALGPEKGWEEVPPSDLVENLKFGDGFLLLGQNNAVFFFFSIMWKRQFKKIIIIMCESFQAQKRKP